MTLVLLQVLDKNQLMKEPARRLDFYHRQCTAWQLGFGVEQLPVSNTLQSTTKFAFENAKKQHC
jgi:hypothetical protein